MRIRSSFRVEKKTQISQIIIIQHSIAPFWLESGIFGPSRSAQEAGSRSLWRVYSALLISVEESGRQDCMCPHFKGELLHIHELPTGRGESWSVGWDEGDIPSCSCERGNVLVLVGPCSPSYKGTSKTRHDGMRDSVVVGEEVSKACQRSRHAWVMPCMCCRKWRICMDLLST